MAWNVPYQCGHASRPIVCIIQCLDSLAWFAVAKCHCIPDIPVWRVLFTFLYTLVVQVACWQWWRVSEMISLQLYFWHEPWLRSRMTSRTSYLHMTCVHVCLESRHAHVYVQNLCIPHAPTFWIVDPSSFEVSVHLPGWDFAGGRVHTLPRGGALWRPGRQGRLGPAFSFLWSPLRHV